MQRKFWFYFGKEKVPANYSAFRAAPIIFCVSVLTIPQNIDNLFS